MTASLDEGSDSKVIAYIIISVIISYNYMDISMSSPNFQHCFMFTFLVNALELNTVLRIFMAETKLYNNSGIRSGTYACLLTFYAIDQFRPFR